jgi:hypothetical protein
MGRSSAYQGSPKARCQTRTRDAVLSTTTTRAATCRIGRLTLVARRIKVFDCFNWQNYWYIL